MKIVADVTEENVQRLIQVSEHLSIGIDEAVNVCILIAYFQELIRKEQDEELS